MDFQVCKLIGAASRVTERKAGNPPDVLKTLADRRKLEPSGDASLQNAVEMAMSSMGYVKSKIYVMGKGFLNIWA